MKWLHSVGLSFVLLGSGACVPEFEDDSSRVDELRVLGLRAEPPEVLPGKTTQLTLLLGGANSSAARVTWSWCTSPKAPTENGSIAAACVAAESPLVAGYGITTELTVPRDACRNFGPDTTEPGLRPRDPDGTGGYYQPLRIEVPGLPPAFHRLRIACRLLDAPAGLATRFAAEYRVNESPKPQALTARVNGKFAELAELPVGASVEFEVALAAGSQERFAYYDRAANRVTTARERLSVAWYSDIGAFEQPVTESAEDRSANIWHAPKDRAEGTLWIVLRDSRGGADFVGSPIAVTH